MRGMVSKTVFALHGCICVSMLRRINATVHLCICVSMSVYLCIDVSVCVYRC